MKASVPSNDSIEKSNWVTNPTRKAFLLVVTAGLVGYVMIILAMTNFFNEPIVPNKYFPVFLIMMIPANIVIVKVVINYFKTRKNPK